MEHILLFSYVFTLPVAAVTLTLLFRFEFSNKKRFIRYEVFLIIVMGRLIYEMLVLYNDVIMGDWNTAEVYSIFDFLNASSCWAWIGVSSVTEIKWRGNITARIMDYGYIAYLCVFIFAMADMGSRYAIVALGSIPFFIVPAGDMIWFAAALFRRKKPAAYAAAYGIFVPVCMLLIYMVYLFGDLLFNWKPYEYAKWLEFAIGFANLAFVMILNRRESERIRRENYRQKVAASIEELAVSHGLTEREKEILREMYDGKSNAEIAAELVISASTVKTHMHNVLQKMGLKNRVDAIHAIMEGTLK
jgi:DNA-binding CsgD family transcriptional regulator